MILSINNLILTFMHINKRTITKPLTLCDNDPTLHLVNWNKPLTDSFFLRKAPGDYHPTVLASCGKQLHTHGYHELFLVVSGRIIHHINKRRIELQAGDLAFIRADDIHCLEECGEPTEAANLSFPISFIDDLCGFIGEETIAEQFLLPEMPLLFHLPINEKEKLAESIIELQRINKINPRQSRAQSRTLVTRIFLNCLFHSSEPEESKAPEWLQKLCNEMNTTEHLRQGLAYLKKNAPCSQENLCKVFRQKLSTTPTRYINEKRIRHASLMLIHTDQKIAAIASDVGFKSEAKFYKIFQSLFDCTPTTYRKEAGKAAARI